MRSIRNQAGFASLALMVGSAGLVASIAVVGLVDIASPLIVIVVHALQMI